jgi:hypothetical protein
MGAAAGVQACGDMGTGQKSKYKTMTASRARIERLNRFRLLTGCLGVVKLAFAAGFFNLTFQSDDQFAYAGLIHWFDQTQGLIQNSSLVFRPVGQSGNRAKLAIV